MPGYDIERFVDLTECEKNELICSICHDILRCPVVTHCCLQSFCDDCINEWIRTNNTCPYDRKSLTADQLSRAPRAMMNLLGNLRIRCDFSDNGCNEVIVLENLSNHSQQCQYKECAKCFSHNKTANHDCVEYLLDANNKLTVELNQLKLSYEELSETHRNISAELNQLKKTHEDMIKYLGTSSISNVVSNSMIFVETDRNIATVRKLKDVYMAKSLSQLDKKAEETKSALKGNDILTCTKSALKLYSAAMYAMNNGDEERAYVFFYRFIDLYQHILKLNDYAKHKQYVEQMIDTAKVTEALTQSAELSSSLRKRYVDLHYKQSVKPTCNR